MALNGSRVQWEYLLEKRNSADTSTRPASCPTGGVTLGQRRDLTQLFEWGRGLGTAVWEGVSHPGPADSYQLS